MRPGARADRPRRRALPFVAAALLLAACEPAVQTPGPGTLKGDLRLGPVEFAALPGWASDPHAEALPALRRSCGRLLRAPAEREVGPAGLNLTAAAWRAPCADLAGVPDGDDRAARAYVEEWFTAYALKDPGGGLASGKFTGYFEIELNGARHRGGPFQTPVYGPPADLPVIRQAAASGGAPVPYASRAEIEQGGARWRSSAQAPVLFWAADPVDVFFLHIQGSGRVSFADGSRMRVGYAADNGHRFVPIGRLMLERGLLAPGRVSMQSVRAWLRAHPEKAAALMAENPRFIFFRAIVGDGPVGAAGTALTPGRSLAVDPAYVPLGAPVWLDTSWPGQPERPLRRLMVAQDTGAAIKGPGRGDVYWGSGDAALELAGGMNEPGTYYLLLPTPHTE